MVGGFVVDHLASILGIDRLTEVVDVGANPIDGDAPYKPLLTAGLCRVTGFEPQKYAFHVLETRKGPNERYLPYAISDGQQHVLNICRGPGMTSLLEPDPASLALFEALQPHSQIISREPMLTKRLDDVTEIGQLDFLKIDIQGGELSVFRHGRRKLEQAIVVQTEVSFVPLYKDQPTFGDLDVELRAQGFIPHCFPSIKLWPIAPAILNNNPLQAVNQLLEGDIVYVRDIRRMDQLSDDQIRHLGLIAHHCYHSIDLVLRCIAILEQRGVVGTAARRQYADVVAGKAP